jgi:hypothetical protein
VVLPVGPRVNDFKILRPVIGVVTIDVVDMLARPQVASKLRLGDSAIEVDE